MITRQKSILRLVANHGGEISKLRLVKLAFLLRQNSKAAPKSALYEFIPYLHGPYSFTLNHELRSLERDGWVRVMETTVRVTREALPDDLGASFRYEIDELSKKFNPIPTDSLVSEVYRLYPWYTANAKDASRRAAVLPAAAPAVYTLGYEGMMLDAVLDLLLRNGMKRLIDVRCNPVARRFGFHRSTLERHCRDVGIRYVHVPELGVPSSWRSDLQDFAAYERLFERYESEVLPAQSRSVDTVGALVREQASALMCMEADCRCCHRSRLAGIVSERTGLAVRELREL